MLIKRRSFIAGTGYNLLPLGPILGREKCGTLAAAIDQLSVGTWSPESVDGFLSTGFFQEDVVIGRVASHIGRGIMAIAATQDDIGRQPLKAKSGDGIVFPAGSGASLIFPSMPDALRTYRWCLAVVRIQPMQRGIEIRMIEVNVGRSSSHCTPSLVVTDNGKLGQLIVGWGGASSDVAFSSAQAEQSLHTDGQTWNCILSFRRNGRQFLSINGKRDMSVPRPTMWSWPQLPEAASNRSLLGGDAKQSGTWAYDTVAFGQTELTEILVSKLEGWAMWRVGQQNDLPRAHAYRHTPPSVDEEDRSASYTFDGVSWSAWGSRLKQNDPTSRIGTPLAPAPNDFVRVFKDDFRTNSVSASSTKGGADKNWFAPGWNLAVGADARLRSPDETPALYRHEAVPQDPGIATGGRLTLSLKYDQGWLAPALYSVNDAGQGRSWAGEKIFRLRCRFPRYDNLPGGFFPAFWSYALAPMFHCEDERVEVDFWEFDGRNGRWLNALASHVHAGIRKGISGHLARDATSYKVWGGNLDEKRLGLGHLEGMSLWDGEWHTWEVRIQNDTTVLAVTLLRGGREVMVELVHCQTPKEYLLRLYLIVNYALRLKDGEPDRLKTHSFDVDFIEVLQRQSTITRVSPPFKAQPTLLRVASTRSVVLCITDVNPGLFDLCFYWYSDGYPRGFTIEPRFMLTQADRGTNLRCMVKVLDAQGQPEMWTDEMEIS
jgi:hypothetical protein